MKLNTKKGTNTHLNLDILEFKNTTLSNESRAELGDLAAQADQDLFFLDNIAEEQSFFERNKYRNYYEGSRAIKYTYHGEDKYSGLLHKHDLQTSATSGFIKTPGFGQPFQKDIFHPDAKKEYVYMIYIPTNIAYTPGLTMVLEFDVDIQLYGGTEKVTVDAIQEVRTGAKAYEEEVFKTSGHRTRRYNASIIASIYQHSLNAIKITYKRENLTPDMVSKVAKPTNNGFSLEWYFEDSAGKRVEIEQEKQERNVDQNKEFTQFINIIHTAVTEHDVSLDRVWNSAKQYWLEYINKINRGEATIHCDKSDSNKNENFYTPLVKWERSLKPEDFVMSQFLQLIIEMTSPKINIPDFSYNPHIKDSFLEDGFPIFFYLTRCVSENKLNNVKHIMDMFRTDSHTNILEVSLQMMNKVKIHQKGKDMWGTSSAKKIEEKLQSLITLDISKLDILSSKECDLTQTRVERITDVELKENLKLCFQNDTCKDDDVELKANLKLRKMQNGTCKGLRNILKKIGKEKLKK